MSMTNIKDCLHLQGLKADSDWFEKKSDAFTSVKKQVAEKLMKSQPAVDNVLSHRSVHSNTFSHISIKRIKETQ